MKGAPPGGCKRHKTVFNRFGVIPEYCFGCYKVLITPRTVMELFKLLMVFERIDLPDDCTRKCMVEGRAKCAGTYKGYVYCRGIEEGKEMLGILEKMVATDISANVWLSLERGCSEFARVHPGYARIKPVSEIMGYPAEWKVHEDSVDREIASLMNGHAGDMPQADDVYPPWEIFALQYWLSYAATIGDLSYLKISGRIMPLIAQLNRPPFSPPD